MTTVRVRLFAGLKETIGERCIELQLPDGATVGDLRAQIAREYPLVKAILPTTVCAVDEEYVNDDRVLTAADDVALIPPVSGGSERASVIGGR
jgi:molybdopterin synthase catalytic subunit